MRASSVAAGVLGVAIAIAGCHQARIGEFRGWFGSNVVQEEYSQEQLAEDLTSLARLYRTLISSAADEITARSPTRAVRRYALLWEIEVIPEAQRLAFLPNVQHAFVSMVIFSVALREYFTVGEGRDLFGEQQEVAVNTATELEGETFAVGAKFLTPAQLEQLARQAETLVRANPIRGAFVADSLVAAAARTDETAGFNWVLSVPLVPFRALTGVSEGAQAVREFNTTAQEFSDVVAVLPMVIRWQIELLLYDVEDRDTTVSVLAGVESIAESARRISEAVERLPDDLRASQSDVRRTLDEARATLVQADRTLLGVRELADPFRATAEQINLAGASWTAALQEIRALQGETAPGDAAEASAPFDIRDYERTARELKETALELQRAITKLHLLLGSEAFEAAFTRIDGTIAHTESGGQELIAAATWGTLQILVAVFVLLVAYRILSARLARPR